MRKLLRKLSKYLIVFTLVVSSVFTYSVSADEAVASVNGTSYSTLQEAIDAASEGETVTLNSDVKESVSISKSLTLDLNGHTITSKDGDELSPTEPLDVDTINFKSRPITIKTSNAVNIIIKNGILTGGQPEWYKQSITDKKNYLWGQNGGGLYIDVQNANSNVTLSNLKITGNTIDGSGAGMYATGKGNILISECEITNNTIVKYDQTRSTGGSGAGISIATASNVTIEKTTISNNNAGGGNGGAISSSYATLVISESNLSGNNAGSTGGAITASTGTNLTVNNSVISNNTSSSNGGAIFGVQLTGLKINETTISCNKAGISGGGIYLSYVKTLSEESFKNSSIVKNTASWGGGLSLINCETVTIPTDLTVNNNVGANYGASDIYSQYSALTINAPAEGTLSCGHAIDGWYFDGFNGTQWVGHSDDGSYYTYKYNNDVTFKTTQVTYLKAAHGLATVKVNYVYEDGSVAEASVTNKYELGGTYAIESPVIKGYVADKDVVEGTIKSTSAEFTVTYSKAKHNLTINYIDEESNTLSPSYIEAVAEGDTRNVESPVIDTYTTDTPLVEVTMGENDIVKDVVYKKITHNLTIYYVDEAGNPVADTYVETVAEGASRSITSPNVEGYTALPPVVDITMGKEDIERTVVYQVIEPEVVEHTLTINYIDEAGNTLAESHVESVLEGETRSVTPPTIEGYTTDTPTVNVTMGKEDITVNVVYKAIPSHTLTINYVDEAGNTLSGSHVETLLEGNTVSVTSPSIEGYTTVDTTITRTMGNEDITVNVVYTKVVVPEETTYTYTLNYASNGGSAIDSQSATSKETTYEFTVTSTVPTRDGYSFVGWATTSNASEANVGATVSLTSDNPTKTIYAVWKENSTPVAPVPETPSTPSDNNVTPSNSNTITVTPRSNPTAPVEEPEDTPEEVIIEEPETPTAEPEEITIDDDVTPLSGNKGAWALINLIASVLTVIFSIILLLSKRYKDNNQEEDEENEVTYMQSEDEQEEDQLSRKRRWKVVTAIVSIISVVVFILTENMRLPMVLVDKWTLLMVAILAINLVVFYFGRKWHEPEEEEEELEEQAA